jgi:hypothetical protein
MLEGAVVDISNHKIVFEESKNVGGGITPKILVNAKPKKMILTSRKTAL